MSTSRLEDSSRTDRREDELIDRWLDEGDRLSDSVPTTGSMPVLKRRRLAEGFAALGDLAGRRKFTVVVVGVAVSAVAIVALRAASHAVLRTDPVVVAEEPMVRPAAPAPSPPPTPAAVPAAAAVGDPQPAAAPVSALAAAPADPEPVPPPAKAPAVAQAPSEPEAVAAPPSPAMVPAVHAASGAQAAPVVHPLSAATEPEPPAARTKPAAAASASDSMQECQAALRRERAKPALVACEKFSRENPTSVDALVMLAHANLLAGADGETLRLARRASFLDPKNADAYLLVGTVLQTMGRMPAARSAYQSYLQNAPHGSHAAEVRAILKTL
jgi:hypothetical protein